MTIGINSSGHNKPKVSGRRKTKVSGTCRRQWVSIVVDTRNQRLMSGRRN
jgi:hypothetical protein